MSNSGIPLRKAQYSFERIATELKRTYSEGEIEKAVEFNGILERCTPK